MQRYSMPTNFSGKKFKRRYKLTEDDFWADSSYLYVLKALPDEPPIFEQNDPLPLPLRERILAAKDLDELKTVLGGSNADYL